VVLVDVLSRVMRYFGRILTSARNGNVRPSLSCNESCPIDASWVRFCIAVPSIDPEGTSQRRLSLCSPNSDTFDGNEIQFAAWVFKISRTR
jgi:hypothetical protein